jgi:ethanolamine utilization protein EutQ (cupin superfamily)
MALLKMGCDGGTIPKRSEVVKVKQKEQKVDEATVERIRWAVCALSQQPLREPIVADELGHVMSREAVLEALVTKCMPKKFKHIRSLKVRPFSVLSFSLRFLGSADQALPFRLDLAGCYCFEIGKESQLF